MSWTAQASSSAEAVAASGGIKYARDKVAGLPCTCGKAVSPRAAVKLDMEGVLLPRAQTPLRLGCLLWGWGPGCSCSFLIFLK